jgi:hypothetical protein
MRGQRNKRRHNNQTKRQKAMARQEVVAQQEAMQQPTGQVGGVKALAEQWQRWVRQQSTKKRQQL